MKNPFLNFFATLLCVVLTLTVMSCGDDDDDDNNDDPGETIDNELSLTIDGESFQSTVAESLYLSQTSDGFTVVTAADTLTSGQLIIFTMGFEGTSTGSYDLTMGIDDDGGDFIPGMTIAISSNESAIGFIIYEATDVTLEVEEISTSAIGFTRARFSGTLQDMDTGESVSLSNGSIVAGVR